MLSLILSQGSLYSQEISNVLDEEGTSWTFDFPEYWFLSYLYSGAESDPFQHLHNSHSILSFLGLLLGLHASALTPMQASLQIAVSVVLLKQKFDYVTPLP